MSNTIVASTSSIVTALTTIVETVVDSKLPITVNKVLLYEAGSTLTPINLGILSN